MGKEGTDPHTGCSREWTGGSGGMRGDRCCSPGSERDDGGLNL